MSKEGSREGFRHYDYSDVYYNAIVHYLRTGEELQDVPFVNFRHKWAFWKRIKEERAYSFGGDQNRQVLLYTNKQNGQTFEVVPKSAINDYLTALYYNLKEGLRGRDAIFHKVNATTVGISRRAVMDFLRRQEVHQLMYPTRRNTVTKPVVAKKPMEHWQMDLFDMSKFKSPQNNQVEYVLSVIDVFSKYLWLRGITNKSAPTVVAALKTVVDEVGGGPTKLQSDRGSEFIAQEMRDYCKSVFITQVFSLSYSPSSQGIVERSNRTVKGYIQKYMLINGNRTYIPVLKDIAYNYNHTLHSTIGSTPFELHFGNNPDALLNARSRITKYADKLLIARRYRLPKSFNIKEGDTVRIDLFTVANTRKDIRNAVKKQTFEIAWSRELYRVVQVRKWKDKLDMDQVVFRVAVINPDGSTGNVLPQTYQPNNLLKVEAVQTPVATPAVQPMPIAKVPPTVPISKQRRAEQKELIWQNRRQQPTNTKRAPKPNKHFV